MGQLTLLDFHAEWCGPCKSQGPIVDEIDKENEDVKVRKIDVEEKQILANDYSVRSLPTLVLVEEEDEEETVLERFVGLTHKDELEDAIDEHRD